LNIFGTQRICGVVRRLNIIVAILLAAFWLPLTNHCLIESLSEAAFLTCATEHHHSHSETSETDSHDQSGCCALEASQYHLPKKQESTPALVLVLPPLDLTTEILAALPAEVSLGVLTAAPPELPSSWQFITRNALPVRAPSFAS
jgi:hypothetical protein